MQAWTINGSFVIDGETWAINTVVMDESGKTGKMTGGGALTETPGEPPIDPSQSFSQTIDINGTPVTLNLTWDSNA